MIEVLREIGSIDLIGERIARLERENDLLRKALDDAPRDEDCVYIASLLQFGSNGLKLPTKPCDCWKAALARILEAGQMDRSVKELLAKGREIWGDRRMTLPEIAVAMGVVYGDICRVGARRL